MRFSNFFAIVMLVLLPACYLSSNPVNGLEDAGSQPDQTVINDDAGGIEQREFEFCDVGASSIGKNNGCCVVRGSFRQPTTAAPQPGQLFTYTPRSDANSYVYYMASNGRRYVIPMSAYLVSWFGNLDEQGVPIMDPAVCGLVYEYPNEIVATVFIGGNVTARPGTYMLGVSTDTRRWISAGDQSLRPLRGNVATDLFGAESIERRTLIVPDAFFPNYRFVGTEIVQASDVDLTSLRSITLEQDLGISP